MSVSQVEYDWLLRNYAAAVDALDFAHSEGFEWPHDPFGEVALAFADIDNARDRLPHNPDCAHCRKHAIADRNPKGGDVQQAPSPDESGGARSAIARTRAA